MRRGALSVCALVLALLFVGAIPEAAARRLTGTTGASTARENALVDAVNLVRTLHLLPKLRVDPRLTRAARFHSGDMLLHDYFGHGNFTARMARFHVRGRLFGENLAYSSGVMSAKAAVADWLASPEHRSILLDPTLHRIGVATPIGAFDGFARATMVTADFAG
jgi:uncharacterized protein YkwD